MYDDVCISTHTPVSTPATATATIASIAETGCVSKTWLCVLLPRWVRPSRSFLTQMSSPRPLETKRNCYGLWAMFLLKLPALEVYALFGTLLCILLTHIQYKQTVVG